METSLYRIEAVAARPIAAVRGRVNEHNVSERLGPLLTKVWDFLRAPNAAVPAHLGINVVIYHDQAGKGLFLTDDGVPIEAGVLLAAPFAGESTENGVYGSTTPTGRAARATHIGPYEKLGETHTALRDWCNKNGYALTGTTWEVYGHWTNDPAALETDIFYLLKESND